MEDEFPEDLLQICTQNLLPSWDEGNDLDLLLSQVPDLKEFPEVCDSNSLQVTQELDSQDSPLTAQSSKPTLDLDSQNYPLTDQSSNCK